MGDNDAIRKFATFLASQSGFKRHLVNAAVIAYEALEDSGGLQAPAEGPTCSTGDSGAISEEVDDSPDPTGTTS